MYGTSKNGILWTHQKDKQVIGHCLEQRPKCIIKWKKAKIIILKDLFYIHM